MCLVVPWIIPAFVPFVILFFSIRRRYLRASREVKRSDATSRSPLYSRLDSISKVKLNHLRMLSVWKSYGLCMHISYKLKLVCYEAGDASYCFHTLLGPDGSKLCILIVSLRVGSVQ